MSEKPKVFVSYSRRDSSDFAEELVAGLVLANFTASLDRHDIAPGEDWQVRLGGLIQEADTVVFVITPEAVKSERCAWEIDKALADTKRVLPVIFKHVPEADIPPQLQRRQFVRFDTGLGINRPLAQLVEALRHDIDWIREHTRLGEMAARWQSRQRPNSMLLRGDDLITAQSWPENRKSDSPVVSELVRTFIATSKEAELEALEKSKAARGRLLWARALAAVCVLALIMVMIGWWNQNWIRQEVYALANVHDLTTAKERELRPKGLFKECTDCPEMIVVPAGSFMMGSPPNDPAEKPGENPQHNVTIVVPFAVSKFEITFADWDACAAHGDCDPHVSDGGYGRGQQPAINVAWAAAKRYVTWLSNLTGKPYRLLSEAEFEYAARAGTHTAYPWGDDLGTGNANCIGCGGQWNGKQPAPVGSFGANAFGLHDMSGNVWEWVEDCVHSDYSGAPQNGSAWVNSGDCNSRIARGGSWNTIPAAVRSASRLKITAGSLYFNLGFRVGRSLVQ